MQPARQLQNKNNNNNDNNNNLHNNDDVNPAGNEGPPATLAPTPRTLHLLWHEYQFGLKGRKPARLFTAAERGGQNKYKYCRRKVFWDLVSDLIRVGMTANVAIDRIYQVYGVNRGVMYLINNLRRDWNNNTLHPQLQVQAN